MTAATRRATLAAIAASAMGAPSLAVNSPDAALVAACAEHREALVIVNREGGKLEADECALMQRYVAAVDALDEIAEPKTMQGVIELSRSALAEAEISTPGDEDWRGSAGEWAGQAVKALLRLACAPAAPTSRAAACAAEAPPGPATTMQAPVMCGTPPGASA
ncbi:hypothetical protein [Falsiroseomonas sp.]|uniref:hypothetical protein n=1 Tax=Falsiroseomonas sp. TaxID=2870721 RepID=UPI00271C856E|nr:hypothetical protein [Falsiroseomonas sp.]MDO9502152.1 hypothetical protein [Falsiroseomonas sp.]